MAIFAQAFFGVGEFWADFLHSGVCSLKRKRDGLLLCMSNGSSSKSTTEDGMAWTKQVGSLCVTTELCDKPRNRSCSGNLFSPGPTSLPLEETRPEIEALLSLFAELLLFTAQVRLWAISSMACAVYCLLDLFS